MQGWFSFSDKLLVGATRSCVCISLALDKNEHLSTVILQVQN